MTTGRFGEAMVTHTVSAECVLLARTKRDVALAKTEHSLSQQTTGGTGGNNMMCTR